MTETKVHQTKVKVCIVNNVYFVAECCMFFH